MKDAPLMPVMRCTTLSGKIVTVKSVGPNGAVVEVKNDGVLCCCAGGRHRPATGERGRDGLLSGASSIGEQLRHA